MKNYNVHIVVLLLFAFAACNRSTNDAKEAGVKDQQRDGRLMLTAAQFENAGIQFGSIEKQLLSLDVHAKGRIKVPHNAKAIMASPVGGTVHKLKVMLGNRVGKGDPLAVIHSPDFITLQKDFLVAKSRLNLLELDFERQKSLKTKEAVSEKIYQKARSEFFQTQALFNALGKRLDMLNVAVDELTADNLKSVYVLKSPINGYVDEIYLYVGQFVECNDEIFSIINRQTLYIELDVFEKDIMKVLPGQRVTFSLANLDSDTYEASIKSISGSVVRNAKVMRVLAGFDNSGIDLLPGMFVSSTIHTREGYLDALPENALLFDGNEEHYIFYSLPFWNNDTAYYFNTARVKPGFAEDGYAQVTLLDSIPEEAKIVVQGGYYLKSETMKEE
ncbi:MAG: efflux RND transporter periplasmic adaptor subunit [Bacteroidales bacterium]